MDGFRLIQMYQNRGLELHAIDNSVESGISEVKQRMLSGRLKVFASLEKYLAERRRYRRDENDQVVRERDNLQDATRCLVLGISTIATPPHKEERPVDIDDMEDFGRFPWATAARQRSGPSGIYRH
jgi:hypothetical protein